MLKEVEAPTALTSGRAEESKAWQHIEPVKLNAKNLDMNAFNQMFEKTHMADPDHDGRWRSAGRPCNHARR